jgi:hypothetical protein
MYIVTWASGRLLVDLTESLRVCALLNAAGIRYTCRPVQSWPVVAPAFCEVRQ